MKPKKGFTLVELIVVIAVIGILAAVLIPTFTGATESARKGAVQSTADTYRRAYLALAAEKGTDFIQDEEGLDIAPFTAAEVVEFSGNQEDKKLYLIRENIPIDFIDDGTSSGYVYDVNLAGFLYFDGSSGYYSYFDARNNKFETLEIVFQVVGNTSLDDRVSELVDLHFGSDTGLIGYPVYPGS